VVRFPTVSVVIPVHNGMPYLEKTIDSVLAQTLDRIEIIAVDDGSTDGSGDFLDKLAHHHGDRITVVHQDASGGPGHPRNVALDYFATGEFVFFLDADDHLGPEALERLVAAARRNDADVVLGKVVGVDRTAPQSMFRRNDDDADFYKSRVYWSIAAWKLFRTDHLRKHGIRFTHGTSPSSPTTTACTSSAATTAATSPPQPARPSCSAPRSCGRCSSTCSNSSTSTCHPAPAATTSCTATGRPRASRCSASSP
jgi:hypothetical protein